MLPFLQSEGRRDSTLTFTRYLALGAQMLQAAGYDNAVTLMQLAYDVEYRIASFDNSEEATT